MANRKKTVTAVDQFVAGSGNYLNDRGYRDPVETCVKFFFSNEIAVAIERAKFSQTDAARMTGLKQPDISQIVNGNVKNFSVWRLMTTLQALGYDVDIVSQRSTEREGRISLVSGADVTDAGLG